MAKRFSVEYVANVAIVIVAVIVGTSYVRLWFLQPQAATLPSYRPGDHLPTISAVSSTSPTLIVYVNSNCHFCTASMPFYGRLVAARNAAQINIAVVAVSNDAPELLSKYVQANGVLFDQLVSVRDRTDLKLRATPTLLLVNTKGTVEHIWVGQLNGQSEREVLDLLTHSDRATGTL